MNEYISKAACCARMHGRPCVPVLLACVSLVQFILCQCADRMPIIHIYNLCLALLLEEQAADKRKAENKFADLQNSSLESRELCYRIVQGGSCLLSYTAAYVTLRTTGAGFVQGLDKLEVVQLVTVVNIIGAWFHPAHCSHDLLVTFSSAI